MERRESLVKRLLKKARKKLNLPMVALEHKVIKKFYPGVQYSLNGLLRIYSESGRIRDIVHILKMGAEIDSKDKHDERTALMLAAASGQMGACKLLIAKGADMDARDNFNRTALMFAAGEGHAEICKLLIEKGANVNARDNDNITAFNYAAKLRNKENINFLAEYALRAIMKRDFDYFTDRFSKCVK